MARRRVAVGTGAAVVALAAALSDPSSICDFWSADGTVCFIATAKEVNCTDAAPVAWADGQSTLDAEWAPRTCTLPFNSSVEVLPGGNVTCGLAGGGAGCGLTLLLPRQAFLSVDGGGGVYATSIAVTASSINVEAGGVMSATGSARVGLLTGAAGNGGSNGGSGGQVPCSFSLSAGRTSGYACPITQCCDAGGPFLSNTSSADGWADPFGWWWARYCDPQLPLAPCTGQLPEPAGGALATAWNDTQLGWGGGGGGVNGGRGGGGIVLNCSGYVTVNGLVAADGVPPAGTDGGALQGGAGAGGSIVVVAAGIAGNGQIRANGGTASSAGAWAAGGGGHIALYHDELTMPLTGIQARGGLFDGVDPPAAAGCFAGSAGTVFLSQRLDALGLFAQRYSVLRFVDAGFSGYATSRVSLTGAVPLPAPLAASGQLAPLLSPANVDAVVISSAASIAADALVMRRLYTGLDALRFRGAAERQPPATIAAAAAAYSLQTHTERRLAAGAGRPGAAEPAGSACCGGSEGASFFLVGLSMASGAALRPLYDAVSLLGQPPASGGGERVAGFLVRGPTTPNLTITASEIELTSGTLALGGTALFATAGNITLGAGLSILTSTTVSMRANQSLFVESLLSRAAGRVAHAALDTTGAQLTVAQELDLYGRDTVYVDYRSDVTVDVLHVASAKSISVLGRLSTTLPAVALDGMCADTVARRESCGEVLWDGTTAALPPPSNYTLTLSAPSAPILIDDNGDVFGEVVLLCGSAITVQGSLSATGLGCEPGGGLGPGAPGRVAGGGGGHAGPGGGSSDGGAGGGGYDSDALPQLMGSGGGSALDAGGKGGGFIAVVANSRLEVEASAYIAADGTSGTAAGGGGAGGTLLLRTSRLMGGGALSANGGAGLQGGGGGSGGRIALLPFFRGQPPGVGVGGSPAADFTGTLTASGGAGSQGAASGANGSLVAPACSPGYGTLQCTPCGAGWYQNGTVNAFVATCRLCTNGPARAVYTDATSGSAVCAYACPSGYLYPTCESPLEEVLLVFGGPVAFSAALASVLAVIVIAFLCLCRRRWRALNALKRADRVAVTAEDGGRLSRWGGRRDGGGGGEGAAALLAGGEGASGGRYGASTPLDDATRFSMYGGLPGAGVSPSGSMGPGGGGFASLVAAGAGGAAAPEGVSAVQLELWAMVHGKDAARMALFGGDATVAAPRPTSSQLSWRALSRADTEVMQVQAALAARDLPRFACRVYLGGCNTFGSSWRLPEQVPAAARRYVRAGRYMRWAARLNAELRWPRWGWEEWGYFALSLLFTPAATYLHKWRKRVRVLRLLSHMYGSGEGSPDAHDWLHGTRTMALRDALRVGVSGDSSLAYIDVLRDPVVSPALAAASDGRPRRAAGRSDGAAVPRPLPPAAPHGGRLLRRGLRLPLGLLLSGDGSFESPMFLDPNDVLVRAVPALPGLARFIDNDWVEFVAEFNARARCIAAGAVVQTAGPALAFLQAVNDQVDALGGLHVQLVRYWPCARSYLLNADGSRRRSRAASKRRSRSQLPHHLTRLTVMDDDFAAATARAGAPARASGSTAAAGRMQARDRAVPAPLAARLPGAPPPLPLVSGGGGSAAGAGPTVVRVGSGHTPLPRMSAIARAALGDVDAAVATVIADARGTTRSATLAPIADAAPRGEQHSPSASLSTRSRRSSASSRSSNSSHTHTSTSSSSSSSSSGSGARSSKRSTSVPTGGKHGAGSVQQVGDRAVAPLAAGGRSGSGLRVAESGGTRPGSGAGASTPLPPPDVEAAIAAEPSLDRFRKGSMSSGSGSDGGDGAGAPRGPRSDRFSDDEGGDGEDDDEDGEGEYAGDDDDGDGDGDGGEERDAEEEEEEEDDMAGSGSGSGGRSPSRAARGALSEFPGGGHGAGGAARGGVSLVWSSLTEDVVGTDDVRIGLLVTSRARTMASASPAASAVAGPALLRSPSLRGTTAPMDIKHAGAAGRGGDRAARMERGAGGAAAASGTSAGNMAKVATSLYGGGVAGGSGGAGADAAHSLATSYADLDGGYFQLAVAADDIAVVGRPPPASNPLSSPAGPRAWDLPSHPDAFDLNDGFAGGAAAPLTSTALSGGGRSAREVGRAAAYGRAGHRGDSGGPASGGSSGGGGVLPASSGGPTLGRVSSVGGGGVGGGGGGGGGGAGTMSDLGPVVVPAGVAAAQAAPDDPAVLDDVACCPIRCANVGCSLLSDALTRTIVDIGSHDDVMDERLNMRLPYPGISFGVDGRTNNWVATQLQLDLPRLRRERAAQRLARRRARSLDASADAGDGFGPFSHSSGGAAGGAWGARLTSASSVRHPVASDDGRSIAPAALPRAIAADFASPFMRRLMVGAAARVAQERRAERRARAAAPMGEDSDGGSRGGSGSSSSSGHSGDEGGGAAAAFHDLPPSSRSSLFAGGAAAPRTVLSVPRSTAAAAISPHFAPSPSLSAAVRSTSRGAASIGSGADAAPAPPSTLWVGGVTCQSLARGRTGDPCGQCFRRCLFAFGRMLRRTMPPLPGSQVWRYYLALVAHTVLMLGEVSMTFIMASELWCVESEAEAGAGGSVTVGSQHAGGPRLLAAASATGCNYAPVITYLVTPPLACIGPPLLGLAALAMQSSRGLRIYATWNGASMWVTSIAFALVATYMQVLGAPLIAVPIGLLTAKTLAAQCVPVQLAHIEASRPIRGWRGLFEVRNGPVERSHARVKALVV